MSLFGAQMKKEHKVFVEFLPFLKEVMQKDIMASVTDLEKFIAYVPGTTLDVKLQVGAAIPPGDPLNGTIKENKIITAVVPKEVYGFPFRAVTYPIRDKNGNCIGAVGIAESLAKEQKIKEALDEIMHRISGSNEGITEISHDVSDMAMGIQELSAVVEEVNASVVEINELAQGMGSMMDGVASASKNVIGEAKDGISAVKNINVTISESIEEILSIKEQIEHLNESIESAYNTISFINNLAEQTNLLALNASIEAARAGEHGRGFAVVADEVGKLAIQSKESSVEISGMMKTIQSEIAQVVKKVAETANKSDSNKAVVQSATTNIEKILTDIQLVDSDIQTVKNQMLKQANNTAEIRHAVDAITVTIEEKAAAGSEINALLRKQSSDLDAFEKDIKKSAESIVG